MNLHHTLEHQQTIIAQCTPRGSGALALLRLSGNNACAIVDVISILPQNKKLRDQATHTIHYGYIIDENKVHIDHVLFMIMHGPRTFTGENTIEITCHNNPFIIEKIIALAIQAGARVAAPGEFSRRAHENGKLDLLQAEALNELIHANTQHVLKKSLAQLKGSLSHWITTIEQELVTALAWCEASFEFLDDEGDFGHAIAQRLQQLLKTIAELKQKFHLQKQIRDGIRIALIGSVNAGKSSLFNTILNDQRSIVTAIAGTTRDSIEAGLYRSGNYWTLIDTAGLRKTDDIIEQEGIKRSFDEAHRADIILLVVDAARLITPEEENIYKKIIEQYHQKVIVVFNKIDIKQHDYTTLHESLTQPAIAPAYIALSTATKENCAQLETIIEEKIVHLFAQCESPFLLNQRHYTLLLTLEQKLTTILNMLSGHIEYELVSYHLRETLETLSELTGKSISEAALDKVFKEFCVGK